jgi:hypothetical protein
MTFEINLVEPHVLVSGCVDYSFIVVQVRFCWEGKSGDSSAVMKGPKLFIYKISLPYWDHVTEIHVLLFLHNFGDFASVCPSVFESLVF